MIILRYIKLSEHLSAWKRNLMVFVHDNLRDFQKFTAVADETSLFRTTSDCLTSYIGKQYYTLEYRTKKYLGMFV